MGSLFAATVAAMIAASVFAAPAIAKPPAPYAIRADLYVVADYDPTRDAAKDLELAMAMAAESKRNILLDVGGDWCVWCHILDDYLAKNRAIGDAFAASF